MSQACHQFADVLLADHHMPRIRASERVPAKVLKSESIRIQRMFGESARKKEAINDDAI
jgi:hypothetical protein